ncbi:MAG: hypothetical protein KBC15_03785 [Candidatus Levybacteria bacterium]|nr:hypothetical protein [Candidatus Levybacteria bacterium]
MTETSPLAHQEHTERKPTFDGGKFTIEFLTSDPNGLEVKTVESLYRRDRGKDGKPLHDLSMTDDEKESLRVGMKAEIDRFGYDKDFPREALDPKTSPLAYHREIGPETSTNFLKNWINKLAHAQIERDLVKTRRGLVEGAQIWTTLGVKVGIEDPQLVGNVLNIKTRAVSFPAYNKLSKPDMNPELENIASASGVSAIIKTVDNKFILQHRAEFERLEDGKITGNASFAGVPGASAAGYFDALMDHDRTRVTADGKKVPDRGRLKPVATTDIRAGLVKEAHEELNLEDNSLTSYKIVGLAHDNLKPHHEFLFLGETLLTFEQIKEKARSARKNQKLSQQDFEEKFVAIDATPKAIETLLTQVECPVPPTHSAAFLAAGYALVLKSEGLTKAQDWMSMMNIKIKENTARIDQKVRDFYTIHPDLLNEIDPDRSPRNPDGYSTSRNPSEQGLPTFDEEMERTGLISS